MNPITMQLMSVDVKSYTPSRFVLVVGPSELSIIRELCRRRGEEASEHGFHGSMYKLMADKIDESGFVK